jgi:hypothetical protein
MSDRESIIESRLVEHCKAYGILTRKVSWIGRRRAMDRLLVFNGRLVFVELKSEAKGPRFPADEDDRAQAREHDRFRAQGIDVRVLWTKAQVDALIAEMIG